MNAIELARHQPAGPQQLVVDLYLPPHLFWFRGHFAVQPVLPGVAQIDWVMHYARVLLEGDWQFSGIDRVKFQRPLLPEQHVRLQLDWQPARAHLLFSYTLVEGEQSQLASQGQIQLCR